MSAMGLSLHADEADGAKRLRIEAPNPALSLVNPDLDAGMLLMVCMSK